MKGEEGRVTGWWSSWPRSKNVGVDSGCGVVGR